MTSVAVMALSCNRSEKPVTDEQPPICKPQITLTGDRLTPEALWAMGRIGSVVSDIETGWLAYSVSYYSVEENRSTTWIRICNPCERMQVLDEFVGSDPAWFGGSGALAYMKGGKLYLRRDGHDVLVEGSEDTEGFLLSPMRDKVVLIKTVKAHPTTADKYPDLPLASGRVIDDLMYKHWDEWVDEVPQPFVYDLEIGYHEEGEQILSARVLNGVNVLEGTVYESPMRPFGGVEQLAWNPNNKELAYTCRKKTGSQQRIRYKSRLLARWHKDSLAVDGEGRLRERREPLVRDGFGIRRTDLPDEETGHVDRRVHVA